MSDVTTVSPKLWFDLIVPESYNSDCACACPSLLHSEFNRNRVQIFAQQISVGEIQHLALNQPTFIRGIDGYMVVLHARGEHLVVLDPGASRLLTCLPCSTQELRIRLSTWTVEMHAQVIGLLLALQVLKTPHKQDGVAVREQVNTLEAWLHLTNACNMACQYCYVTHDNQQMSVATAQRTVAAVYRSALEHSLTHVRLKYAGGEPTLNFETLLAAQQCAEEWSKTTGIGLEAVLLTNGLCISDDQIDMLRAHNIQVTVSLDGKDRYQNQQRVVSNNPNSSFELVAHTLGRLLARGVVPHISITITKPSLNGLPELVEFLLDRQLRFSFNFYREPGACSGSDPLAFTPAEMIQGVQTALQIIEQRLPAYSLLADLADRADLRAPHLHTCGVGRNYLVIDCNGKISKCQMEMRQPVTTIESDDPLALVRADAKGIQNLSVEAKECRECLWRYRCTGGCPRLTFQRTGRYDAKSPLCEVYKTILPEVVRLEALRLLKYQKPWDFSLQ